MITMAWIMFYVAVGIIGVGLALLVAYGVTNRDHFGYGALCLLVPALIALLVFGILLDQGSQSANESRAILVEEYMRDGDLGLRGVKGSCRVEGNVVQCGPLRFRVIVEQLPPQGEKEN